MGENGSITSAGFLTCDRPAIFRRSIMSFVENALQFGREMEWIIVDDSRKDASMQKNRETARLVAERSGHTVRYYDRRDRAAFADLLALKSGVPVDVCRFALLGDGTSRPSHGAARNTLLLLSIGELSVQIDDDVICNTFRPIGYREGIRFSILASNLHIPLERREDALRYLEPAEVDFFGEHEQVLGKRFGELIRREKPTRLDPHLWPDSDDPVLLSNAGIAGDCGMEDTSHRVALPGTAFELLTRSPETYQQLVLSHEVIYGTEQSAICRFPSDPMMNMGIDSRRLLPPFMPSMRAEETLFASVLWRSRPRPLVGQLPMIVLHDRKEARPAQYWPPTKSSIGAAELMHWHIQSAPQAFQVWGLDYINPVAHLFMYQSRLPEGQFTEWIESECDNYLSSQMEIAEKRLDEEPDAPEFWRQGLTLFVADLKKKRQLSFNSLFRESELHDPMRAYASIMYQTGRLLYHWKSFWKTANILRTEWGLPLQRVPKMHVLTV